MKGASLHELGERKLHWGELPVVKAHAIQLYSLQHFRKVHPTPPEPQKTISELDRTPGKAMFLLWIPRQENKTRNQNQSSICRIKS